MGQDKLQHQIFGDNFAGFENDAQELMPRMLREQVNPYGKLESGPLDAVVPNFAHSTRMTGPFYAEHPLRAQFRTDFPASAPVQMPLQGPVGSMDVSSLQPAMVPVNLAGGQILGPSMQPPFGAIQPTHMLSPGALARQQRATADSKRGKRRRPTSEGSQEQAPVVAAPVAAQAQVVPIQSGLIAHPPNVRVKEERRKKRLLRNRVSAQQARERKRQHTNDLEGKCNHLQEVNDDMEERITSLTKENEELRQLVRNNMRGGSRGQPGATSNAGSNPSAPRADQVPQLVDANCYQEEAWARWEGCS